MRLTVLGSGSTVPHPERRSAGFWLETNGGTVLLDCSASAIHRVAEEGLEWPELDAIWISHFHLDHCGGLASFLAGTKHAPAMKERSKTLKIVGPMGIKRLIDKFSEVNNYKLLNQSFPIDVIEVEALESFAIAEGVEAVAAKTPHTTESHAIHIRDTDGKTLVYSSDTAFDQSVAALARAVDLFILECTFLKDKPVQKHLELAEAMFLIRKAKPKRAMLTHFYPEWDDVEFDEEIAKFSPGCEVIEAFDGLRVEI
jgi:ribonuclease BN (tRNA processing enzyme)